MKNYILITLALSMTFHANAQFDHRYADLRIEFTAPDPGTVIYSPGTINYTFKLVNQGPDSLYATDTIKYNVVHGFLNGTYEKRAYRLGHLVIPGDSIYIHDSIGINGDENTNRLKLFFSPPPKCYSPDPPRPLDGEFWDDVTKDNFDDIVLVHRVRTASVDPGPVENQFKIYPNPTKEIVTVEFPRRELSYEVRVYSNMGQLLQNKSFKDSPFTQITLPEAAGVYWLEIRSKEGVARQKVIKNPK